MAKVDKFPVCPYCRKELSKFHKQIFQESGLREFRGEFHFCINPDCIRNDIKFINGVKQNRLDGYEFEFIKAKK